MQEQLMHNLGGCEKGGTRRRQRVRKLENKAIIDLQFTKKFSFSLSRIWAGMLWSCVGSAIRRYSQNTDMLPRKHIPCSLLNANSQTPKLQ